MGLSDVFRGHVEVTVESARYWAPEVLQNKKEVTDKADVYSCALIFYEMMTCETPFSDVTTVSDLIAKLNSGSIDIEINFSVSPLQVTWLFSCLNEIY
jgi:serine/threonine protein kinase